MRGQWIYVLSRPFWRPTTRMLHLPPPTPSLARSPLPSQAAGLGWARGLTVCLPGGHAMACVPRGRPACWPPVNRPVMPV